MFRPIKPNQFMNTRYFILVFLFIIITSCHHKLKERWVLLEKKGSLTSEERNRLNKIKFLINFRVNDYTADPLSGSFIQLSTLGKYNLRMNTIYSEGKWTVTNDTTILLIASTSDSIPLRVVSCRNDTLRIKFLTGNSFANYFNYLSNDEPLTFITDSISYFKKANPYSYKLNKWALKANHKLTEKEIRAKLINYIDYLIAILKDPRDNSNYLDKVINPVCIANNGISLVRKNRVDPEWQNLFYTEEGFNTAYNLLQNTFRCNVNIKDTHDLVDLDVDILKQIRVIIKQEKHCE